MFYRRNADTRLRNLERNLRLDYTANNLILYNQERFRSGLPAEVAPELLVRDALRNALPEFYVWGIQDLRFPGLEIQFRMTDADTSYPVLPRTIDHFNAVNARIRAAIPLLLNLGWVALIKQCGEVSLRLKRNREYDEWIVEWRVDGELDEAKSYYTDDKEDAEQTLIDMKNRSYPAQYPEIIALPRTVLEPSGRPIHTSHGRIVADQWRRGENPLSLTHPEFRTGTYPTAIILVDRSLTEPQPTDQSYVTWAYRVPYEAGRGPSTDHGHYDMTLAQAKLDYLQRLLNLPAACNYELFEA
jgi:hypothetical protein